MQSAYMDRADRVLEIMEKDIPLIDYISSIESGFFVELGKELKVSIDSSESISPTLSVPVVTPTPKRKTIILFYFTAFI